jgi:2-iminobutanoate/2-iminopropanoate deaminase
MLKPIIQSSGALQAAGPYSHAVRSGDMVYCLGQLPIDVATGEIPDGVANHTRAALRNLSEVLKSSDSNLSAVLKTIVFMTDMDEFDLMNHVYEEFFLQAAPARSTV